MVQNKFLLALSENKKNQRIGHELFVIPLETNGIKQGKSVKEIITEMKKASTENLLRPNDDVSFS